MSFLEELKRRKVIRVAIGYAAAGWLILEVADVILGNLSAPDWAFEGVLLLVVLGFPVALALSWAFDINPDPGHEVRPARRRLDAAIVLIVVAAAAYFLIDWFVEDVVTATDENLLVENASESANQSIPPTAIAVLAFENRSADPEQEYLAFGLAEEILYLLTRIPEFDVTSPRSSFSFSDSDEDIPSIGRILGVGSILSGAIQKSGDLIRINVQLADASDGRNIWADSFNETLTDTFAVQERVAAEIVDALQLEVGALPNRGQPTDSADAYSDFLRARIALDAQRGDEAIELLERAVEIDDNFAEAHEYLAFAYWQQAGPYIPIDLAQQQTRASATRALAIDPSLTFANALMEVSDSGDVDDAAALELLYEAVQEQPANSAPIRALIYELTLRGYLTEANRLSMQLVEQDPLSPIAHYSLGESLVATGQSGEALAPLQRSLELDNAFTEWFLPAVHLLRGEDEVAAAIYTRQLEAAGIDPVHQPLAMILSARDPGSGKAALDRQLSEFLQPLTNVQASDWRFRFRAWYLIFGHLDDYFDQLEALGLNDQNLWADADLLLWLGTVFRISGFTAHPRFVDVSRGFGNVDLWERRGAPDFCSRMDDDWVCE